METKIDTLGDSVLDIIVLWYYFKTSQIYHVKALHRRLKMETVFKRIAREQITKKVKEVRIFHENLVFKSYCPMYNKSDERG